MNKTSASGREKLFFWFLLIVSILLMLAAVLAPFIRSSMVPDPAVGDIARRDYRAAEAISFTSEVLTKQRRDLAERTVLPIYSAPDTRVARRQLEQLRSVLTYITNVRMDTYATQEQKLNDLSALEDIHLEDDAAETILRMSDARWQEVQKDAITVLEGVMRSAIRPETLQDARNRAPALVSLSLPEDQAAIVADLAAAYVAPNSQFSESLTQAARQQARDAVEPVTQTFVPGQTIALQGEVLGPEKIEALQHLGLTGSERNYHEWISAALLSVLLVAFMVVYLRRKNARRPFKPSYLLVLALLQLTFLAAIRIIAPSNLLGAYVFPLAACGLVTAALFGTELAMVSTIPLSILAAYGLPNSMELTIFYLVSGLFGVLILGKARRLITFMWAGLAIAISGALVVWAFRFPLSSWSLLAFVSYGAAVFFNGLVSASLAILLYSLFASPLELLTPVQLLDLTRPDHPLLQNLLRDAPGTYQHSLQVASLAEQAAERLGLDPLLIRAGSLYHDVGKLINPACFIENQPPGFENPHDTMAPEESARIIIAHVTDGLKLARKYHLPRRIQDFITEHHGTTITNYQYYNAVKAAGGDESLIDKTPYQYPGPRPQTPETAILMLADASEARVRAERPPEDESLRSLIMSVVSGRVSSGQLDDTRLSMQEINAIVDSFSTTLRGIYHPRINYPNPEMGATNEPITLPIPRKAGSSADVRAR